MESKRYVIRFLQTVSKHDEYSIQGWNGIGVTFPVQPDLVSYETA